MLAAGLVALTLIMTGFIQGIAYKLDDFFKRWDDRIKISDQRFSTTEQKDSIVRETAANVSREAHITGEQVNKTLSYVGKLASATNANVNASTIYFKPLINRQLTIINNTATIVAQNNMLLHEHQKQFDAILDAIRMLENHSQNP